MSVTEQHLGLGRWSLGLSPAAPVDLVDIVKYFGHIMITPQWFDPLTYNDAGVKSLSAYTGIVLSIKFNDEGRMDLGGPSLAGWLGTRGSRGYLYQIERFYDADTFTNVLTRTGAAPYGLLYRDDATLIGLSPGTITDPSSGTDTYTAPHIYQTPAQAIEYFLGLWGKTHGYTMEYRVNPDGTIDFGQASDLFVTTPRTIIQRNQGFDPVTPVVPVKRLGAQSDAEDYITKVLIMASGYGFSQVAVAGANQSAYPSNVESTNIGGMPVTQIGMVNQPFTTEENAQIKAEEEIEKLAVIRQSIDLDTADYDISGREFKVGDYVYIYDPIAGLVDTSNKIFFEGDIIYPVSLRVLSSTWPIREGMGVFYRSGSGTYTDLTRWVVWEQDETKSGAE